MSVEREVDLGGSKDSRGERDVAFRTPSPLAMDDFPSRHQYSGADAGGKVLQVNKMHLAAQWAGTILVLLLLLIYGHFVHPHCRGFSWLDEMINKPHEEDTFPNWSLLFVFLAPVLVTVLCSWAAPVFPSYKMWEASEWVYGCILFGVINSAITEPCKLYAGRLRPDFLGRLVTAGYNSTYPDPMTTNYCDISVSAVMEGRKSFPSGHSSWAFASMTFLSLFLFNRFRTFQQADWRVAYFVVSVIPMVLAFVIAISRTRDDRHHFADVVAGSLIGLTAAFLSFRLQMVYCTKRLAYIPARFRSVIELPPIVVEEMPVIS